MAAYFQLIPRVDPGHGPMSLSAIDNGIREFLGLEPDDEHYAYSWYDTIGFMLALGATWQQVDNHLLAWVGKANLQASGLRHAAGRAALSNLAISQWLQQNYIVDSWYQR